MFSAAKKMSTTAETNLETHLAFMMEFTTKALSGFEKLIDLNVNAAMAILEESKAMTQKLLAAKDSQEFLALSAALTQPGTDKALAYSHHLANITSSTHAALTEAADAQIAETKRAIIEFVRQATKHAPPGSENAVIFVRSAIANASSGYEKLAKGNKQVVETIESHINKAVNQGAPQAVVKHQSDSKKNKTQLQN